ncbi:LysR substrate-binding domain-containing protein [Desulfosporosinus acididurans]|uniref:LysR substrate-binding domain-containing protein n=1 Tax=Desulfosporosinus acididurans TaxID=476652 RepID=UPI00249DA17D|nr:LysR substrate-binding domain-containing protein [Desulfosporosinus acididurans]
MSLKQLESAKVDVSFCTLQQPFKDFSSLHIMTLELFVIVDKDHRLANVTQIDLSEIADDPFVLYKPQTALLGYLSLRFARICPVWSVERSFTIAFT